MKLEKENTLLDLSILSSEEAHFIKEKTQISLKDGSYPFLIYENLEYNKCMFEYFAPNSIHTDINYHVLSFNDYVKIHF